MQKLLIMLSCLIALNYFISGCLKSTSNHRRLEVNLDTFRCRGVVERCPQLARLAATYPIIYRLESGEQQAYAWSYLVNFVLDSTRYDTDSPVKFPGPCPTLNQEDLRCILGPPLKEFAANNDQGSVKVDIYSMTWSREESRLFPNRIYRTAFPYFTIGYDYETGIVIYRQ